MGTDWVVQIVCACSSGASEALKIVVCSMAEHGYNERRFVWFTPPNRAVNSGEASHRMDPVAGCIKIVRPSKIARPSAITPANGVTICNPTCIWSQEVHRLLHGGLPPFFLSPEPPERDLHGRPLRSQPHDYRRRRLARALERGTGKMPPGPLAGPACSEGTPLIMLHCIMFPCIIPP